MEQYIPKSALVAEINELKKEVGDDEYWHGYDIALDEVLYFINSLEVKEVDFDDQDIYGILYLERMVMRDFGDKEYSHEELCQEVLKRFKAQKV